jgi:Rieske Fe-S protein
MEQEECKGCSTTVHISPEEIQRLFGETLKVRNVKLVTEEVYRSRLQVCTQCASLDYNTTCRHCGCLVQIKAKLAGAKCPFPYSPKW